MSDEEERARSVKDVGLRVLETHNAAQVMRNRLMS